MMKVGIDSFPKMHIFPLESILYVLSQPHYMTAIINIVGNIILFVPLGFILPFVCKTSSITRYVFIGATISIFIEALQLLQQTRFTEFDDVMLNSLGTYIGSAVSLTMIKVKVKFKLTKPI
jgi:glycopeptide antibiotics resistance protein